MEQTNNLSQASDSPAPAVNPEMIAQLDGLDAMLYQALKASNAPKKLFDSWASFLADSKKFAAGETLEPAPEKTVPAKITAMIEMYRKILPDRFVTELETFFLQS